MATAQDVIDRVRDYYGERIPTQLEDARLLRALNDALKQLYLDAPEKRLKYNFTDTGPIGLGTYGSADMPANILRLVSVRDVDTASPLLQIPAAALEAIDSSSYMTPRHPVFAVDGRRFFVRPVGLTVEIQYIPIPAALTGFTATVPIGEDLVPALAALTAGLCFVQEESPEMAAAMFEQYQKLLKVDEVAAQ